MLEPTEPTGPPASPPPLPEPVAVVIPVHNAGGRLAPALARWDEALSALGREYTIIVVNDGSTDGTGAAALELARQYPRTTVLSHDKRQGFGACLCTALPACTAPILAHVTLDYPYDPVDLKRLLDRLDQPCDVYGVQAVPDAVSGCRVGRPVPAAWRLVGRVYRAFYRVVLGVSAEPLAGWLGFREHARAWVVWLTMGVPLADVNSGLRVFRRRVFERFPIQSDSDFAHAEIFAKLTFLTALVAEEPLTPASDPVPPSWWADFWTVFRHPRFHHPLPDLSTPAPAPPPAP